MNKMEKPVSTFGTDTIKTPQSPAEKNHKIQKKLNDVSSTFGVSQLQSIPSSSPLSFAAPMQAPTFSYGLFGSGTPAFDSQPQSISFGTTFGNSNGTVKK
eukprot:TRINITY_DN5246_c0_g1_i1.p1 TRINITY_DN5246_c0_g1~~TRINITY_DN5246_c0_g1_i1.p1  ORF type:complete len:100 (+),score=35.65 TRINITY_DN5246_c0_g1_i1:85-384(+)